ncbi:thioester domain-containing protein [Candidatus Enterococcus mansonii]|uniref:Uncharacterized protein n=1 Tax=Candidatus Enterococcus mansonii TaxID=1834181 RepID=A0A242CLF2_9ENTE|nr:thioester domain-containing protein [Enterococcus sp. 4G2_DIV0659]OTO10612.1 hypothetical protein A5880_001296 [Enterococcus sp. 4G2_DIV0659]
MTLEQDFEPKILLFFLLKKVNKVINRLLLFILIALPFITSASSVYAAEVSFHKIGDSVSTWHSKLLNGIHWTEQGSNMMTADENPAFFIEHGIPVTKPGAGFESIPEKDRLALIAYYGYQTNPNALTYTITQHIIWETLGNELLTTQVGNAFRVLSNVQIKKILTLIRIIGIT